MSYYQNCEDIGNELFIKWANETGYFVEMDRQPLLSRIDWVCKSKNGVTVNCELKVRNTLEYSTIFVEPGKYYTLMNEWKQYKRVPLYINFCGNETIAFDLRKCRVVNAGEVRIWDGANKCYTMVNRFAIYKEDGVRYINGVKE